MTTTFDLPEPLVRELRQRARQTGHDLADEVAELLWTALGTLPAPGTIGVLPSQRIRLPDFQ
jgi:hypothetical protein